MTPNKDLLMHVQTVLYHSGELHKALATMEKNLLSGSTSAATLQKAARLLQARVEPEGREQLNLFEIPPVEAYDGIQSSTP